MGTQRRLAGGLVLVGVAAAASAFALPDLPARTTIHFGPGGTPDDYASPLFAAAFVPALMLGLLALFEGVVRVDPLRENLRESGRVYDALVLGTLAFLVLVHGLVLAYNLGYDVPMTAAVAAGIGALYVLIGFVLADVERNWAVGVRTPWTLSDDVVWEQTHAHAARAFVFAGLLTVALAALVPEQAILAAVGVVLVVVAALTAYSYLAYRRRHPEGDVTAP